ncbi:MAG: metalloregulator ArsR/SmtB family transcription factor [Polyangiaceae bacterium]
MSAQSVHAAPLDLVFLALADPARRGMVERLSRESLSVSELAAPYPMSLQAVMQHVQMLEASGLVRSEKVGRVRTCSLEEAGLRKVEQWVASRRATWEKRLDRLGDFLLAEEAHEISTREKSRKPRRKR